MNPDWRNEAATENQKEKLRFFGCTWDEGITTGQASDALGECAKLFPDREAAWQLEKAELSKAAETLPQSKMHTTSTDETTMQYLERTGLIQDPAWQGWVKAKQVLPSEVTIQEAEIIKSPTTPTAAPAFIPPTPEQLNELKFAEEDKLIGRRKILHLVKLRADHLQITTAQISETTASQPSVRRDGFFCGATESIKPQSEISPEVPLHKVEPDANSERKLTYDEARQMGQKEWNEWLALHQGLHPAHQQSIKPHDERSPEVTIQKAETVASQPSVRREGFFCGAPEERHEDFKVQADKVPEPTEYLYYPADGRIDEVEIVPDSIPVKPEAPKESEAELKQKKEWDEWTALHERLSARQKQSLPEATIQKAETVASQPSVRREGFFCGAPEERHEDFKVQADKVPEPPEYLYYPPYPPEPHQGLLTRLEFLSKMSDWKTEVKKIEADNRRRYDVYCAELKLWNERHSRNEVRTPWPFPQPPLTQDASSQFYAIPALKDRNSAQHPASNLPPTIPSRQNIVDEFIDDHLKDCPSSDGCYWLPVTKAAKFTNIFTIFPETKLTNGESRQIGNKIERSGYCLVPDARYETGTYDRDQILVVFKPFTGDQIHPSPAYLGVANLLRLCVLIAAADGQIDEVEMAVFRQVIENQLDLTPTDHRRLSILEKLLVQDPSSASKTLANVAKSIPAQKRLLIGKVLVRVAAADNVITKDERRALERIFMAFEISEDTLENLMIQACSPSPEGTIQKTAPGSITVKGDAPKESEAEMKQKEEVSYDERIFIPQEARGQAISSFQVSVRLRHIFEYKRFCILGDIHGISYAEIRGFRNCGKKTVTELRELVCMIQLAHPNGRPDSNPQEFAGPFAALVGDCLIVPASVQDLNLCDLPVSVRLGNILAERKATRLGDLNGVSISELKIIKNCGKSTILEIVNLIEKAVAGEFKTITDANVEWSPIDLANLLDTLISEFSARDVEILNLRLSGDKDQIPTLEDVAAKFDVTRESVRQVVKKLTTQLRKAGSRRLNAYLQHIEKTCRETSCPLTPKLFEQWLREKAHLFRFSPGFYARLLCELNPACFSASSEADPERVGKPATTYFTLDMAKVYEITSETKEVVAILSVLMEDEPEKPIAPAATITLPAPETPKVSSGGNAMPQPTRFNELDAAFHPILERLLARDSWPKNDFKSLADEFHFMPLNICDTLNEWSDEALGDFILDGEDPVVIRRDLLAKEKT